MLHGTAKKKTLKKIDKYNQVESKLGQGEGVPGQLWLMFKGSKDVKTTLKNKSQGLQQTSVSSEKWES